MLLPSFFLCWGQSLGAGLGVGGVTYFLNNVVDCRVGFLKVCRQHLVFVSPVAHS